MCHVIILATLLSLASGQTSDCYDQNVRYNGDSLTVTKAKYVPYITLGKKERTIEDK